MEGAPVFGVPSNLVQIIVAGTSAPALAAYFHSASVDSLPPAHSKKLFDSSHVTNTTRHTIVTLLGVEPLPEPNLVLTLRFFPANGTI